MADQALFDEIARLRAKGKTDQDIQKELLKKGWNAESINGAYAVLALEARGVTASDIHAAAAPAKRATGAVIAAVIVFLLLAAAGYLIANPKTRPSQVQALMDQFFFPVTDYRFDTSHFVPFASEQAPSAKPAAPKPASPARPSFVQSVFSAFTSVQTALAPKPASSSAPASSGPAPAPSASGSAGSFGGSSAPAGTTQAIDSADAPNPFVDLTSDYASVPGGTAVKLTWSSTDATSCSGAGFSTGGAVNGNATVHPYASATYTITCTGEGGTAQDSASVAVSASTDLVSTPFNTGG